MADKLKVVINLATGLEDAERVTCTFLVGGAAAEQSKDVVMFLAPLWEWAGDSTTLFGS